MTHHAGEALPIRARPTDVKAIGAPERRIFGIKVRAATAEEAIDLLDQVDPGPCQVAFLNANNANHAWEDPDVADAFRSGLVLNDGIGLELASRVLYGAGFPEDLNGTDFVPRFLQHSARTMTIYIVGGAEGIAERAASALAAAAPRHRFVGSNHGYFDPAQSSALAAQIRASGADVLILALGTPKQELWMRDNLAATGVRLGFCVGGLLDFAAGAKPRAPALVRRLRSEWIFRLALEPRRLTKRYLVGNVLFLARLAVEKRRLWAGGAAQRSGSTARGPRQRWFPMPRKRVLRRRLVEVAMVAVILVDIYLLAGPSQVASVLDRLMSVGC